MGENHFQIVSSKIKTELESLTRINDDFEAFRASRNDEINDNLDVRLYGSFLHDFYTCVERIFREIAIAIDGELPTGQSWHGSLLEQMSLDIEGIRPPVISISLKDHLHEFLRFRQIFRNLYGFHLKWEKTKLLIGNYRDEYSAIHESIQNFISILSKMDPTSQTPSR